MVHSTRGKTCGWQVKLCDPPTRPERIRGGYDDALYKSTFTVRFTTTTQNT